MAFNIEKNIVFVSGGAGDIGSSIVSAFAKEGCKIIVGDLDVEAAKSICTKLPDAEITILHTDITNMDSIQQTIQNIEKDFGRVDTLVNVAGILCRKSIFDTEKEDFEKSLSVNVIGAFMLSKAMIPLLKNSNQGAIINISSLNGSAAVENRVVYGATKAALNMVSQSMALELGDAGITVNTVSPGVVDSKMCRVRLNTQEKIDAFCRYIPLGRLTTPDDVASSVLFLASPFARGITGSILLVDGGIIARQALPR